MYTIVWQYTVHPQHLHTFIEYYHAAGKWVEFFQPSPFYVGTDFLQLEDLTFITIDKWWSKEAYEQFLKEHQQAYASLDKLCEGFTTEEHLIGKFYLLV